MNRGFLYGDGFFETIRVADGNTPLLPFHLNRILEALSTYQITPEFDIDEDFLRSICRSYNHKNAIVRINFFREGEGRYSPETNTLAFNHSATETDIPFYLPYKLDIYPDLDKAPKLIAPYHVFPSPKPVHPLFAVKSLSSAYYALAGKYATDNNAEYLLITNDKNQVLEELRSNIIIEKGSQLYTPNIESGGVFGATLRYLIANYGSEIMDVDMRVEDLDSADRIFLCKGSTGLIQIK